MAANTGNEGGHDEHVRNEEDLPRPELRQKSCTKSTITLECDPIDYPDVEYKFERVGPPHRIFGGRDPVETQRTETNECTFANLDAQTEYYFRVSVFLRDQEEYEKFSEVLSAQTLDLAADASKRCDGLETQYGELEQRVEHLENTFQNPQSTAAKSNEQSREDREHESSEDQPNGDALPVEGDGLGAARPNQQFLENGEFALNGNQPNADAQLAENDVHPTARNNQQFQKTETGARKPPTCLLFIGFPLLLTVVPLLSLMSKSVTVSSLQRPLNYPPFWLTTGTDGVVLAEEENPTTDCTNQLMAHVGMKSERVPICPHISVGFAVNLTNPLALLELTAEGRPSVLRGSEVVSAEVEEGDSTAETALGQLLATADESLLLTDTAEDGGVLVWTNGDWVNLGTLRNSVYSLWATNGYIYAAGKGIYRWDGQTGWKDVSADIESKGHINQVASWGDSLVIAVFPASRSTTASCSDFTSSDLYVWDEEALEWTPRYAGEFKAGGISSMVEDKNGGLVVAGADFGDETSGKVSIFADITDHKPKEFFFSNDDGTSSSVKDLLIDDQGKLYVSGSFKKVSNADGTRSWRASNVAFLKYGEDNSPHWIGMSKYSLGNIKQLFQFYGDIWALGLFDSAHCREYVKCIGRWTGNEWQVVAKHTREIKDLTVMRKEFAEEIFAYTDASVEVLDANFDWQSLQPRFDSWRQVPIENPSKDGKQLNSYEPGSLQVDQIDIQGMKQGVLHARSSLILFTIDRTGLRQNESSVEILEQRSLPLGGPSVIIGRSGKGSCEYEETRELVKTRSDGELDTLCSYSKSSYEDLRESCRGHVPLGVPIVSNESWPVLVQYRNSNGELEWKELANTPSNLGLVYFKGSELVNVKISTLSNFHLLLQTVLHGMIVMVFAVYVIDPWFAERTKLLFKLLW